MNVEETNGKQVVPLVLPKLPPTPIFDETIEQFLSQVAEYIQCTNEAEFERAKDLGNKGTTLKKQIDDGFSELTRAIDAFKQPVLDRKKLDMARVVGGIRTLDALALPWQREQDRLVQEAANKRTEDERLRKEEERRKEVELLKEWEPEKAAEVAAAPIPQSRPSTAVSGFAYRRGAARKPKLKFTIIDPNAVCRACCSPDMSKINGKIDGYVKFVKNPTPEVLKKWQDEIGGGELYWE